MLPRRAAQRLGDVGRFVREDALVWTMTRSPQLSLAFSCVGHGYAHLFMALYPMVVLALEPAFGLSYGDLLLLAVAGNVLFGAGSLPAGWLGDRWSALGMMAVFFLGTGAAAVLTGLARSPFEIALGLALIGLFASIYHPVGIAWLVRNAARRGRALGINGVFGSLGTAGAALVAGALTDLIDWRAAFIVPGLVALMTGVGFVIVVKARWIVMPVEDLKPGPAAPRTTVVRALVVLSFTMLCWGLIYQATLWAMPKLFSERLGSLTSGGALGVGGLVSLVYLSGAVAQMVGGHLADRFRMKNVYLTAFLLQVPVLLLASTLGGPPLLAVAVAMIVLNIGALPAENGLLARYSPGKWRATAFGAKFVLSLGVGAAGTVLVALIYRGTGSFLWLFVGLSLLAALGTLAALKLPGEAREAAAPAV